MQGDPAVIASLNTVYQTLRSTEEQSHLQEHCFETQGWDSSKWWDCIEDKIHEKCVHPVLNRINDLGGRVTPGYAFDPVYYQDDFQAALRETVDSLTKCRSAYATACEAAEEDGDYVTEKMIWKHLEWIEGRIVKFEGRLLRYGKLGTVVMTGAL
jgi:bacterioferritin (cytochrome b1)